MPFIMDDNKFPPEKYEYYLRLYHANVEAHRKEAEAAEKKDQDNQPASKATPTTKHSTKTSARDQDGLEGKPKRKPPSPPKARAKLRPTTCWRQKHTNEN